MSADAIRERLPNRRKAELLDFDHGGRRWTVCVGRFAYGRVAEIFLSSARDSTIARLAEESAIVPSLALQFGCDIATLRHAISGTGAGPSSAALDLVDGGGQ